MGPSPLNRTPAEIAEIEAAMEKGKERVGRIDARCVNAGIAKLVPFEQIAGLNRSATQLVSSSLLIT